MQHHEHHSYNLQLLSIKYMSALYMYFPIKSILNHSAGADAIKLLTETAQ